VMEPLPRPRLARPFRLLFGAHDEMPLGRNHDAKGSFHGGMFMICSLPPSAQGRARACDMSLQYAPGQLSLPGLDPAPTHPLLFPTFPHTPTAHPPAAPP